MPDIEKIKQKNEKAIVKAIGTLAAINYGTVSRLLPRLLAEDALTLDHSVYTPLDPKTSETSGIGRYLVYDHPDASNPFSIWVFAFAPRQKTCIHDHKYKGTVTVLSDAISEKYYQPTSDNTARRISRSDRYRFHSTQDELKDNFVHQLKRRKGLGAGFSVTLHIYNMEAHVVNAKDEVVDQRNLNTIYTKASSDETGRAPYNKEFPKLYSRL